MKALVIYDSKFGNTKQIAEAISAALGTHYEVHLQSIMETFYIAVDTDLLVIGGPTHTHGVSRPIKELLNRSTAAVVRDMSAAAFDTRFHMSKLFAGAASDGIAERLRAQGARLVVPPESFFVRSSEGPLEVGEIGRAGDWARKIANSALPVR